MTLYHFLFIFLHCKRLFIFAYFGLCKNNSCTISVFLTKSNQSPVIIQQPIINLLNNQPSYNQTCQTIDEFTFITIKCGDLYTNVLGQTAHFNTGKFLYSNAQFMRS